MIVEWPFGIGDTRLVTVVLRGQEPPARGERIYFDADGSGQIVASNAARLPIGHVLDEDTVLRLRHTLESDRPYLAEVIQSVVQDRRLQVRISWPAERTLAAGTLQIVMPARVQRELETKFIDASLGLQMTEWLQATFVVMDQFLAFVRQPDQPEDLILLGPHLQLRCRMSGADFLWAEHAGRLPRKNPEDLFRRAGVLECQVEWRYSETEVPEAAKGALELLKTITARSEYFQIWDTYRDLERAMLVDQVQQLLPVSYNRLTYYPDVIRFHLDRRSDTAAWRDYYGSLSVEMVMPRPQRSRRSAEKDKYEDDEDDDLNSPDRASRIVPLGTVRKIGVTYLDVDRVDDEPGLPDRGVLRISIIGDEVRLDRQQAALERLSSGATPIRQLDHLLAEGKTGDILTYLVPPFLTQPSLLADGKPPHERQTRAIEMALNTPDICVIQGPPGTGKTSVIRTILRRLKDEGRRHLLISSHQHTAVDNVLQGLQGCGVIAYRYGGNETTDAYQNSELESWVRQVSQTVTANLERLNQNDALYESRARLKDLLLATIGAGPDLETCRRLLETLPQQYPSALPNPQIDQASLLLGELNLLLMTQARQTVASADATRLAELSQGLPLSAIDPPNTRLLHEIRVELDRLTRDGQLAAEYASQYARKVAQINRLLARYEFGDDRATAQIDLQVELDNARQLIQTVLAQTAAGGSRDRVTPSAAEQQWRESFYSWCRAAAEALDRALAASAGHLPVTLNHWLDVLNSRPAKVRELFSKHADVWGVTCQQAVAGRYKLYDQEYDYVIIDEAARTSPLDLLIPLVRARRIILVGDHMQLPHALEYRLEKEFQKAASDPAQVQLLKDSLFQRLFERLPDSKKIRLNYQFRMNRVIGDMISRVFYDNDLHAGLETVNLANDTGLFDGKPLVWFNVQPSAANQKLEDGQFFNLTEIECLVKLVSQLIQSGTQRSIGIITYYAQQRDRLERELRDRVPHSHHIQIGTVDAFQGQEKDIILLSMVRSNPDHRSGFISRNRVNVSLSRARRLLVMVGDANTMTASPDLKKVHDYCQELDCVIPAL